MAFCGAGIEQTGNWAEGKMKGELGGRPHFRRTIKREGRGDWPNGWPKGRNDPSIHSVSWADLHLEEFGQQSNPLSIHSFIHWPAALLSLKVFLALQTSPCSHLFPLEWAQQLNRCAPTLKAGKKAAEFPMVLRRLGYLTLGIHGQYLKGIGGEGILAKPQKMGTKSNEKEERRGGEGGGWLAKKRMIGKGQIKE
jgi:hypothetical protein